MILQYTPDLSREMVDLHKFYVSVAKKAGYPADEETLFTSTSMIISEDVAIELFRVMLLQFFIENDGIFKSIGAFAPGIIAQAQELVKKRLADALDVYGPDVDVTLPSGTIIILDDFLPELGSLEPEGKAMQDYRNLVIPSEPISSRLN